MEKDKSSGKNYAALAAAWACWSGHRAPGEAALRGAPGRPVPQCHLCMCLSLQDLYALEGTGFVTRCPCTETNVFLLRAACE